MSIYKPTELIRFLTELGINPKKALSQNFLIDGNIIRKIVSLAQVKEHDTVIEIGPGPGSLTEALLGTGAEVMAIEKDQILAEALKRLEGEGRRLKIYCEDFLKFPLEQYLPEGQKAKVIANLPYNITTPILVNLVPKRHQISELVVMVQEEVARRFTAQPGTSDYSSFTVFLNYYTTPKYGFTVSNQCFFPVPKVQSAVVILELKEPPRITDENKFFEMTRTAFSHRRKMLRGSLRSLYAPNAIEKALESIGKNPLSRPEELDLNGFIALFEGLQ